MKDNKIPFHKIYLKKGSRILTRWKPRPKAVSSCQPCSDSFSTICAKQSNGNYGPNANYTSWCSCVKGIFSSNCAPLWECRHGCEQCISGSC